MAWFASGRKLSSTMRQTGREILSCAPNRRRRGKPVALYAAAFPDMHRELGRFIEHGNTVVVELTLNGTHEGELLLPHGRIAPTHRKIEVPCCDVFVIEEGKVALFRCYNLASVLFAQLGVLENLSAALVLDDRG